MKYKNLKFKLIFLLALGCFTASNVMPVAAGNDADVKPSENNKPVENINVEENGKPGDVININVKNNKPSVVVVGPQEVSGFKLLKEAKITDKPADSVLIYEHELTKMKFVVVPHDYLELVFGGFDYYLFFRVKDGEMKNGLSRFEEKHSLEHLLEGDGTEDYYQVGYNYLFGLGNVRDVNNQGFSNAVTMSSGIGFCCSDLRKLKKVFSQFYNPYFKTAEGRKLFKREVIDKKANYTSGRILSEMTAINCKENMDDDDGNLCPEFSKARSFLDECRMCDVGLPRHSNNFTKYSEQEIFDGACEILDEMMDNFEDSVLVIPSYINVTNTPGYVDIMRCVDSECLSKFKDRINKEKKPRNEKVIKFESKPFELVTEGITGKSAFFDYWESDESNEQKTDGKEKPHEREKYKAKDVAYLKVNLSNDNYSEKKDFVDLLRSNFVKDKLKRLGYKEYFVRMENLPAKNYLLIILYGNDDSLFSEEKLRDTYKQILEEIKSKNADEIYKLGFDKEIESWRKTFNYEEDFKDRVRHLIKDCDKIYELTGGFDDIRINVIYDDFKKITGVLKNEQFISDSNCVRNFNINEFSKALGLVNEFENSVPEILVLQRPGVGVGGEKVKLPKDMVERYRKASPTYEAHIKFKDGFKASAAVIYYGLKFLGTIGFNGELNERGVYYSTPCNVQREFDGTNTKYYLIYPTRERGGFDELFNSPDQVKVVVDRVLKMLDDGDFNKYVKHLIEDFERGGEKAKEYKEYLKKEMGFEFEDVKKMTLAEIKNVIENVVIGETKFMPKQ